MAEGPTREWSDEQLKRDDLPKKDVIKFIQDNAAHSVCFMLEPCGLWHVNHVEVALLTYMQNGTHGT